MLPEADLVRIGSILGNIAGVWGLNRQPSTDTDTLLTYSS